MEVAQIGTCKTDYMAAHKQACVRQTNVHELNVHVQLSIETSSNTEAPIWPGPVIPWGNPGSDHISDTDETAEKCGKMHEHGIYAPVPLVRPPWGYQHRRHKRHDCTTAVVITSPVLPGPEFPGDLQLRQYK